MKKVIFIILLVLGIIFFGWKLSDGNPFASEASDSTSLNQTSSNGSSNGDVGYDHAELLRVVTPTSLPSQEKDYRGFRLSFNADNHTPNWVAWELLRNETDGVVARAKKFWQDEDVKGCPATGDYTNSGYDRGHMCPAADQKWDLQAMEDCFALTNIAPQAHALNDGAWKTLENKERNWADRDSAIVIVAGPIYGQNDRKRIGEAGVRVPGAFFKVIAAPYLESPRGIAFVYPNTTAPGNMQNYVMTIRDVEQLTGFDFFSALPDDIEEMIETKASFRDWN
ncbi:MAG: DNA/RNA non-specific endonuclease [Lepagella sp.]